MAASATKSSYVPPHLRNSAANPTASSPAAGVRPGGPRRMKHAPDISSEVYFPSLSAAMGTDDPNRGQGQANRYLLVNIDIIFLFPPVSSGYFNYDISIPAIEDLKK